MYRAENTLKPLSLVNTMSSTSGVQNLLSNVFRPTFTYDSINSNYTSKLELINIDTVSANAVTVYAANVGDVLGNVYVGVLAGNAHSDIASKASSSNTFVGTRAGTGASNVSNSVFLGFNAGAGAVSASNSISIGSYSSGGGNSNIYIGAGTGVPVGVGNIFLGTAITGYPGIAVSNTLQIGNNGGGGYSNMAIIGNLDGSSNHVGINYSWHTFLSTQSTNALDVNGMTRIGGPTGNGMLAVNTAPGSYTLDVNGNARIQDGSGTFIFNGGSLNTSDATGTGSISNGNIAVSNATGTGSISGGVLNVSNATGAGSISGGVLNVSNATGTGSISNGVLNVSNAGGSAAFGNGAMNIGTSLIFSNNALSSTGGFYSYTSSPVLVGVGCNVTLFAWASTFKRGLVVVSALDQVPLIKASSIVVFAHVHGSSGGFIPILSNDSNASLNISGPSLKLSNTDPSNSHTFTITATCLAPPT